jgi:uncharacterized membrane protein YvbJ
MKCTTCGTDNPSDMNFCQECGQPFPKPVIKSSEELQHFKITSLVTCPACGYHNRAGVKFCEECGQPLPKIEIISSPKPEQPISKGQTCPACGHPNRVGVQFCEECGTPLKKIATTSVPKPVQPKPVEKTCPACGHKNLPDMRFCEECGKPLPEKNGTAGPARVPEKRVAVKPAKVPRAASRSRINVRGWLVAGGILALIAIVVIAVMVLTPEVSRSEAVAASNARIQALYPGIGNVQPVVQTNRTDGDVTYRMEYKTDNGKIIFVVDAETGETFMMGIR